MQNKGVLLEEKELKNCQRVPLHPIWASRYISPGVWWDFLKTDDEINFSLDSEDRNLLDFPELARHMQTIVLGF